MMICKKCGTEIIEGMNFCCECGQPLVIEKTEEVCKTYKVSAGEVALAGRKLVTIFEIRNDEITAKIYKQTIVQPPSHITNFLKQDIAVISFKEAKEKKTQFILEVLVSGFGTILALIAGSAYTLLGIIVISALVYQYRKGSYKAMVIRLKNGSITIVPYIDRSDVDEIYAELNTK